MSEDATSSSSRRSRPPSVRGRRSSLNDKQRTILAVVLAAAAVVGVLSPGAPTGHSVVDALYRAAFVSIVAMAASRSRRWTLVVAAVAPAIFGDASGRICGLLALGALLVAAYTDTRDRIVSAVIGMVIAAGLLHLEFAQATGASAVLAAVAVGPLLWSGYRLSSSAVRRRTRVGAAAFGAMMLLGTGLLGLFAMGASGTINSATDTTLDAIAAAQDGDTASAATGLDEAGAEFQKVADSGTAWWLLPGRLVPIGAQHAAAITTVADTGTELTAAASALATNVDYDALRRPDRGIDLAAISAAAPSARDAAFTLHTTATRLDNIDETWLVSPLTSRLDEYRDKVVDYSAQTTLAATALESAPALLGSDGTRRYVILMSNPAELRDLGGHIGNWAALTASDGVLSLEDVGTPLELSQPQLESAVADDPEVPRSMSVLQPARYPQNWGGAADFTVTARLASRLYQAATGNPVDGVVWADPHAFAALLHLTGPVEVPGTEFTATGDNAVEFLTKLQFAEPMVPSDSLTSAIEATFDRFTESAFPSPRRMGELFAPLVSQGRLRLLTNHDADRELLRLTGLGDVFRPFEVGDYLAVINRNANPSKIDSYLTRSIAYDVHWNPEDGAVSGTVSVNLRNEAPPSGLTGAAIGGGTGLPIGTNQSDVAVLSPFQAHSATINGEPVGLSSEPEGRGWRHTVRTQIPPAGELNLVFELSGRLGETNRYSLLYNAQPTVQSTTSTFTLVPAKGHELTDGSSSPAGLTTQITQTGLAFFEVHGK